MSTLTIRLPSKAAAEAVPLWTDLACPYTLTSHGAAIEREGLMALRELTEHIAQAQRVVLLLAASDVTLLRLQVPPLSAARLKLALPNLIEDQLMSDPADCVIVAGAATEGLRTIAVVQRDWLEMLLKTLLAMGARKVVALPSQCCLPHQDGSVAAAISQYGSEIDLTVRLSEQDGIGLAIMSQHPESMAIDAVQALCAVVPTASVSLYVPQASTRIFQDAINAQPGADQRITLFADNWSRWIAGTNSAMLDLMAGLGANAGAQANWRPWRWPLALTVVIVIMNAVALNIDWWRTKREAYALRANMIQTYKSAFPKETVIVDPLAQMQQKITASQRSAGQLAPDDFLALAADFGEAWSQLAQTAGPAATAGPEIASLEYQDHSLLVRLKTEATMSNEQMTSALAAHGLSLAQHADGVWQIRSAK